jgi:hypothetical protein
MRVILGMVLLCMAFGGVILAAGVFAVSRSAVHEIEALIGMLISAVAVAALYIGETRR